MSGLVVLIPAVIGFIPSCMEEPKRVAGVHAVVALIISHLSRIVRPVAIGLLLSLDAAAADLQFAPAFASKMVLQRGAPIAITGRAPAGAGIKVSLGAQERAVKTGDDGRWSATFDAMPAGGPHVLKASDATSEAKVEDVLIGDVWLFSGQSNMQMGLAEVIGGNEALEAVQSNIPVRLLMMPKAGAKTPQENPGADWTYSTPKTLRKFSAVAWFFAHHLRQDPALANVPLGLIDSSFGGTSAEAWTPIGTLPRIPEKEISGSMFGIPPGHLYNRMIAPLLANPIKGVCWYQGEANAGHPTVYSQVLQNLIAQWRQQWHQPTLPFFIVQLPAFEGKMGGLDFSWLREAQARACRESSNTWLAVTHDTTDGFDLHPREKEEIGRRLSLLARREVYGQNIPAHGPRMERVMLEGDHAVVTFDQSVAAQRGEAPTGFELAGADGEYRYAKGTISDRQVTLRADAVPEPKTVRYAWGGMPKANLISREGLPAGLFRTDDQPPHTLAFQPLPTFYRIETPAYSLETGRGGSVVSLVVGGKQFLSNESNGGTRIPGGFGPRNLAYSRMAGPRRLSLSDGGAELEIACDDEAMVWTVTNPGNGQLEFQISVAAQVEIEANGTSAKLSRGGTKLLLDGIDRTEKGGRIISRIPPHASTQLRWTLLPRTN